jgi:tetratricopeptide (TPR) repeat protein
MKSKKMLLILIFAIVIAAGWIVSIRSVTRSEVIKEQKELVKEADAFMDRGLYVRAISLYEDALQESSRLTSDIQEKLLSAYKEYGDMSSYVKLASQRIAAGDATESEYLTAADYYVQKSDLESAVSILKQGIEQLNSEALAEYYEENRYAYRIRTTKYAEILPTASNEEMPAFNGEKWGYVNENGREVLSFIYDSATPFNEYGYAVVSLNGIYYTILSNGDLYGADDGSNYDQMTDVLMVSGTHILGQRDGTYSYYSYDFAPVAESHQYSEMTGNACGVAAVKKDGKWGIITDSGKVVVDYSLDDVAVNSLGCAFAGERAVVKKDDVWYLIDTEGNRVGSEEFSDAKAPESEGYIAVADASGKWGFIDRNGEWVIDCQYSDAYSFSEHLGGVKIVNDWGYISESNKLVIDEPFQSASPFHNGVAQVGFSEGAALILLDYFEE